MMSTTGFFLVSSEMTRLVCLADKCRFFIFRHRDGRIERIRNKVADVSITRRALARSLMTLSGEQSIRQISISEICDGCHMNRKSFYYHFKDKYDLIEWIFESDFASPFEENGSFETFFTALCGFFAQDHGFWRKVLSVEGQNSFHDYLFGYLSARLALWGISDGFAKTFYADGVVHAIRRWLEERPLTDPDEVGQSLKQVIDAALCDSCG